MFDGFLQSFGLLFLFFLAGLGWLFWFYKRRLKRWYHYGLAASINRFPGRLHLRALPDFRWQKGDRAATRVTAFRAAGFVDLAGFALDELSNARLFALHHPGSSLIAVVHEQEELGTWSDVLVFKPGESQPVVASSILNRAHLYLLPGEPKIHKAGAPEAELIEAARQAAGRDPLLTVGTAEAFRAQFELAYAASVDGRLLQPLEDYEFRRLLKERGEGASEDLDETELTAVKRLLPAAINNELRLVCSAQFLRDTTLPVSDWKQARDRIAVIHDRTPLHELVGRLAYGVCWTRSLKRRLRRTRWQRGSPRELFARLNAVLPPWERYKKLGEVTRPVPADIYRAPLETEST